MQQPDNTAVRTALWRALHTREDDKPSILEDEIGLRLIAPSNDWQQRPDMKYTKRLRASIVARSRFIEDLIIEESKKGINQYVILGAGLDTFVQRRPAIASKLQVYEIDQLETLAWKEHRLVEIGFVVPDNLHFVPVDFEISSWWEKLTGAGFDVKKPAMVACTGVSLYLTKKAIIAMLGQMAEFATGSKIAITFYLPPDLLDEEDKPLMEMSIKGARESGTPFISFFNPREIENMADEAGFKEIKLVSTKDLEKLYFSNRKDNLVPATGEIFLVANV